MEGKALVRDIMTDNVVSAKPETKVIEVAKLISDNNLSGVPVVDDQNKLVGLITEYDLITHKTLKPAFSNEEWDKLIKNVRELTSMNAKDVMNKEPLTLQYSDTYETAMKLFSEHHRVNPVPVIDEENVVVGIISRYDMLKLLRLYGHT